MAKIHIPTYTQFENGLSSVLKQDPCVILSSDIGSKVKIGYDTECNKDNTVVGFMAKATAGWGAVAIGKEANASAGTCCVAIGGGATTNGERAVAIGGSATAVGQRDVAIGQDAKTTGSNGNCIAIGQTAVCGGSENVAIGHTAAASGDSQLVAIGYGATADSSKKTVIGTCNDSSKIYFGASSLSNLIDAQAGSSYTLPIATETTLGGVKFNPANGVKVDGEGYLNLATASTTDIGGIKVGNNLQIDMATGVLSAKDTVYELPTATDSTLGGVKIGSGLAISEDGTVSTTGGSDPSAALLKLIPEWNSTTKYRTTNLVVKDGEIYQCVVDSQQGAFIEENWTVNNSVVASLFGEKVIIGQKASIGANRGVAIGASAIATGGSTATAYPVAVGPSTKADNDNAVAVGVNINQSLQAGVQSTAIGCNATSASGAKSIAIGSNAQASQEDEISFGACTQTILADNINFGSRTLEAIIKAVMEGGK